MNAYKVQCRISGWFTATVMAESSAEACAKAQTACEEADFGELSDVTWDDPKIDEVNKAYACYEPGFEGRYNEEDLELLYQRWTDKSEYADFDAWLWDMLRSGVLVEL